MTIAVRASYILPILKQFPRGKPRKTGGVVYLSPEKNQSRKQSVFFSFGVDPVNWQGFISLRWHVARLPGALVDTLLNVFLQ